MLLIIYLLLRYQGLTDLSTCGDITLPLGISSLFRLRYT